MRKRALSCQHSAFRQPRSCWSTQPLAVGTWPAARIASSIAVYPGVTLNGFSREELALSLSKRSRVNQYNLPWPNAKC